MKTRRPAPPCGVLLIRKPAGCTSFDVIRRFKERLRPKKIGHTGTLDPMATGLLPLCIGEATKLVPLLSEDNKRYRARLRLGEATDTLDLEGQVTERRPVPELTEAGIEACLRRFRGEIEQRPPMYSAVRHEGKRMYELAREGVSVERDPRRVHILELQRTAHGDAWIDLEVTCSTGTYIRSLGADIAEALGTVGHLESLERTACSGWRLDLAHDLDAVSTASMQVLGEAVIPVERVLERIPRVDVFPAHALRLAQGQHLSGPELEELGVAAMEQPSTLWFRACGGTPLILATVWRPASEADIQMKIQRVLRPGPQVS